MPARRAILTALGALLASGLCGPAQAHHGWRWTDEGNFELTGIIKAVQLGNPHGLLIIEADGEEWVVEVGQPWRNARAGLTDEMLVEGVELTASGQRAADHAEKRMKAERVIIDGTTYDLYPDRD